MKLTVKEFLEKCKGDEVNSMKELKLYKDVENSFNGDLTTEIFVSFREYDNGQETLTVRDTKDIDNVLIDDKPKNNWL